ncbi:cdp-diacylglycerol-inositol 3-phosphatidyltransferase 1-like protein [Trifolium pratense]|uniref:Cdp-diacylglycerol-inositol 3-phosphatidyltransferase 1-like protein n=1 Tax=Trifolium pratense TaxID=57577 RepID=A0A2K3PGK0_TRIPR|nr:cdp-diacylglycerol-inositol 3-phosphatidyltransferase 1-like protein [Trifolium pratense]
MKVVSNGRLNIINIKVSGSNHAAVSTFGAVLDMVTDRLFLVPSATVHKQAKEIRGFLNYRISTACLLVVLSQLYKPGLIFLSLLALDIGSHWFQMYSTFLAGKASHKDVKDSTNWLFRAYYGNRMFMAYCCVSCEVLYLILFYLAENQTETLADVSIFSVLLMLFR